MNIQHSSFQGWYMEWTDECDLFGRYAEGFESRGYGFGNGNESATFIDSANKVIIILSITFLLL